MNKEIKTLTKRTLLVTLCLLIILSPIYFAPSNVQATTQSTPLYGGTLRTAFFSDPESFNPIVDRGWGWIHNIHLYANLYRFDDRYNVVGYVMQDYPTITSEPGFPMVYTMELKRNIKWHDNVKMTAADVKFSLETYVWAGQNRTDVPDPSINDRLNEPAIFLGYLLEPLAKLKKIETKGDYTIKLYFNETHQENWITYADLMIFPRHLYKEFNKNKPSGFTFEKNYYNENPVGCGPFKLLEHEPGQYMVMERFEEYFDGVPYLEKLVWIPISDREAAVQALENGEIDTIHEFYHIFNADEEKINRMNSNPEFTVVGIPYPTSWRVTFNFHPNAVTMWPWLDDIGVRKAMELAIDKQTIVDEVLFGVTKTTSTAISGIITPLTADDNTIEQGYTGPWAIKKRDYNPDKARQLLEEAGWTLNTEGVRQKIIDGVNHTLSGVKMPYYREATRAAEAIIEYWEQVGIFVDLVALPSSDFWKGIESSELGLMNPDVGGPYAIGLNTMGSNPWSDLLSYWLISRGEWGPGWRGNENFGWYHNDRVDELFEMAERTAIFSDQGKAIYDEIQYHVHEDVGFILLWNKWRVEAWSNEFAGFGSNRPIFPYGSYFRGEDGSSNAEKGVYWRNGATEPFPDAPDTTITSTMVVPEFMDLRVFTILMMLFLGKLFVYLRFKRKYYL